MTRVQHHSLPVRIFDWSGKHAAGDDLLHICTRHLIQEACRQEDITPVFRQLFGYRASVLGGGTIFGHGVFFTRVVRRIAFDNIPYTVFCSGVRDPGRPLTGSESDRLSRFCTHAAGIGVRGQHSYDWLARQGITAAEIIGDAALSFTPVPTPELPGNFKVGVCLRFMRGGFRREEQSGTNEKNITLFAALCDRIVERFGASLYFFNLSENRFDNDGYAIRQVLSRMKKRSNAGHVRIFSFRDNKDPLYAFSRLSHCDFVLSQRLHPSLVSWISGVPSLSLEYQFAKAADAFSPLGLSQVVLDIGNPEYDYFFDALETVLANKRTLLDKVTVNVELLKRSQIHFLRRFVRRVQEELG